MRDGEEKKNVWTDLSAVIHLPSTHQKPRLLSLSIAPEAAAVVGVKLLLRLKSSPPPLLRPERRRG